MLVADIIIIFFYRPYFPTPGVGSDMSCLHWAGVVGAVGKISALRPQGPQFDPRLCRDLN